MPSNTAAPTAEEAKSVVFRSKDQHLILIRRAGRSYTNEVGEQVSIAGQRYEFQPNGPFGQLTGLDPDDIEWLRNHEQFNHLFTEVGNEPDRERPSVTEAQTEIAKAAARQDAEAIAAIYQREVESYDREPVKTAATAALAALEETAEEGEAAREPVEGARGTAS
jgi:uncharacterized protein YciI